jgi:hypothetical protein
LVTTHFSNVWRDALGALENVTRSFDRTWQKRRRLINTQLVVLFIFQIIEPHSGEGYSSVLQRIWDQFRGNFAGKPNKSSPVSASSMHEARQKIDESVFQSINDQFYALAEAKFLTPDNLWFGQRLFAVDGSKINLPPNLFSLGYDVISKNENNPQGLLSCCYNIQTKMPFDFHLDNHGDERKSAEQHLKKLKTGDIVVYDRGYFSYALLQKHLQSEVHAVFRLSSNTYPEIEDFMKDTHEANDVIIEISPSKSAKKSIRKKHSKIVIDPLKLRLIRYFINDNIYFLGTTNMDQKITVEDFSDVYHGRWSIEEFYKIPKSFLKVEDFHSKNERGVKQELYASITMVTITRLFTNEIENPTVSSKNFVVEVKKKPKSLGGLILKKSMRGPSSK